MMKPLSANNARRSSPSHAERYVPPTPITFHLRAASVNVRSHLNVATSRCMFCMRSTTAETAETSTATAAPVTSWPCLRIHGLCECATCATPCCCREAPPQVPDDIPTGFNVFSTRSNTEYTHLMNLNTRVMKRKKKKKGGNVIWCSIDAVT